MRTVDESSYTLCSPCLRVPLIQAAWRFDPASKRRVPLEQQINKTFVADVWRAVGGELDRPLLLFCSDGRERTLAALLRLEEAGWKCLVGLQGGYNTFTLAYDSKLAPRVSDST